MPDLQHPAHGIPADRVSALPCAAVRKLCQGIEKTGSAISIGLEPCAAYLPQGFDDDIAGHERFLRTVIDATSDVAVAYKFNLAFFEAMGSGGWRLLERVRRVLPDDALVIADAKRGDIGSTAEHYARALYEGLGADSATVNPLMGHDACEPFLAYADCLTFFLVLTSNPGAADFLLPGGLYLSIARRISEWNTRGNTGMVAGATKAEQVAELRSVAGSMPFLIPGIGAQGGDLEATARAGGGSLMLFHVTRGVLPGKGEQGDAAAMIRAKATQWQARIASAIESGRRTA